MRFYAKRGTMARGNFDFRAFLFRVPLGTAIKIFVGEA
jgi:hypothetical protein